MKYFKMNEDVFAFPSDGSQDSYISPGMQPMTALEIDKHLNPKKYLTEAEVYQNYLNSLRPLTRRQFKLTLLNFNMLETIEQKLSEIQDASLRAKLQIEYTEATEFHRTSDSMNAMIQLLGLTSNQVNSMWEYGLTQ